MAAVLLSGCLGGGGGGGGGSWIPQVGDFVEYTVIGGEINITFKWTVKSVSDTTMTINTSTTIGSMGSYYSETTIPKNQTFGFNSFDVNHPPSGYTVTKVGTENLDTKWGSRSCDHYQFAYTGQVTSTGDLWIRNGVLLKVVGTSSDLTETITLTDTNISQVTNA